jgi:nucleotide-binding universal stress UspA family protein
MHIVERDAPQAVHGERHLTEAQEARDYLEEVARSALPGGLQVEQHVHVHETADVARGIVEHAAELAPDLIVMCTHGWGGLRGLMFGSIAQQVVAQGATPMLLIQPDAGGQPPPFACRHLLVPWDGAPDHVQALPVAAELACACQAELYLLLVVPTLGTLSGDSAATGRLLPGATAEVLELATWEAEAIVAGQADRLRAQGLLVSTEVGRSEPVASIIVTARRMGADLIVMGTHGRAGTSAFWAGSIAPRVCSRTRLPLLLVPVTESVDSYSANLAKDM